MQKNFENGQNSGVQLQLVAKYASLVVLLLVGGGGGVSFKRWKMPKKCRT